MPPTSWDVDVYLANFTLEERETQSANDSMTTSNVKAMLSSLQGKAHTPKNYKPHQSRFEVNKEFITPISDFDLLILYPFIQSKPFLKFSTMLGSGATKCFIDDSFVSTHKLPTHPLEHRTRVVMADGRAVVASRGCTIPRMFDNYGA